MKTFFPRYLPGGVALTLLSAVLLRAQPLPMEKDTIVRIYSMSKPITSVAVMMLFEEGRFRLDDPAAFFIQHFPCDQHAIFHKSSTLFYQSIVD